jgi:hypothetical protein
MAKSADQPLRLAERRFCPTIKELSTWDLLSDFESEEEFPLVEIVADPYRHVGHNDPAPAARD